MNVNDLEKNVYFVSMLTVTAFATMFLTTNLILAAILSFLGFFCVGMLIAMNYYYYIMTRKKGGDLVETNCDNCDCKSKH